MSSREEDRDEEDYEDDFEDADNEHEDQSTHQEQGKMDEGPHHVQVKETSAIQERDTKDTAPQTAAAATDNAESASDKTAEMFQFLSLEEEKHEREKKSELSPTSLDRMLNQDNKSDEKALWNDVDPQQVQFGPRIGGGGFALVYKGKWKGESVAIKSLFDPKVDEQLKQDFMDELHVMRQLSHPAIVQFKGASTQPPHMFFIMELCKYGSLFSLLHEPNDEQRKLTLDDATLVKMATDVASAIEYLHTRSPPLIHRDIKSHNLLVTSDLRLKLCDFGLVATRNTTAGTPNYMAPELLADRPFSKSVDVYSFGILLWEMWSGYIPFHGWRVATIRTNVCNGERPDTRILKCPEIIVNLMKDCWQHDYKKRPNIQTVTTTLRQWRPQQSSASRVGGKLGGGDALDGLMKK